MSSDRIAGVPVHRAGSGAHRLVPDPQPEIRGDRPACRKGVVSVTPMTHTEDADSTNIAASPDALIIMVLVSISGTPSGDLHDGTEFRADPPDCSGSDISWVRVCPSGLVEAGVGTRRVAGA